MPKPNTVLVTVQLLKNVDNREDSRCSIAMVKRINSGCWRGVGFGLIMMQL